MSKISEGFMYYKVKEAGNYNDSEIMKINNMAKDFSRVSLISTEAILRVVHIKLSSGVWDRNSVLECFDIVTLHINNIIEQNRLGLI